MHPREPRGPIPCKYGDSCKHFAQGSCRFMHDGQQGQGQMGRMGNPNMNHNQNPNVNPNMNRGPREPQYPQQQYPQQNYPNKPQGNFHQRGNTGWVSQQGNHGKGFIQPRQNNQNQPFNKPNFPPKGDQYTSKFCMSFHYNQPCKFQQRGKCSRIHGFDQQGKIRRIMYDDRIPPQQPSKLGKFVHDGQTFLVLRMGNQIKILTFNQQTGQFAQQKNWIFPKPQLKYTYYSQKQNFIYISAQNPKTTLHDIIVYDMFTGILINIEEAHASHVTGVIHFNSQILLSSSKDGMIRVWKVQGDKASLDKQSSDHLLKTYSTGKSVEIMFLDLSTVNGMKVLSAGTNDNRVLFFIGDQMQYTPLSLAERNAFVYKIQYVTIGDVSAALVLTWARDHSASSIVSVKLDDLSSNQIIVQDAKQNPRNNICLIQIIEERLFVANLAGVVTIYSLPGLQKSGTMIHRNSLNSILGAQHVTKTQIKIPQLFVLESKYLQKPGSIGVYTLKK